MSAAENDRFIVTSDDAGQRLDKFVADRQPDWSRTAVQSWIREQRIRVDGCIVKGNYRLKEGERVEVDVPAPVEMAVEAEAIPLDIAYEDADVVVVNKPRGMVVHPAPGNSSGTLVNALLAHCDDLSGIGGVYRPGIVHRIDKDTSGLIMVAKNDTAHHSLAAQLKEHSVERRYIAVVHGNPSHDRGRIDAPIGRDPRFRQRMAVEHKHGKPAVTHFEVLERLARATMLACRLETGRTHQIRVHMKMIGHPLVGDPLYSNQSHRYSIQGQALHAETLGFTHPRSGERIRLTAALPEDMHKLITELRQS